MKPRAGHGEGPCRGMARPHMRWRSQTLGLVATEVQSLPHNGKDALGVYETGDRDGCC